MKKDKEKKRFPSISRLFPAFTKASAGKTDNSSWLIRQLLTILVLSFLLVLIILVGFNFLNSLNGKLKLDNERAQIISQINYWKDITQKYKGYRDGYFELALLEYRLNDIEKAKTYLQTALEIDPNFQKGRELERILNSK